MNAPLPRALATTDPRPVEQQAGATHVHHGASRRVRRRRRGQREADKVMHNHATDRWMVSYADFITLLFAFFVVMYAISSVNEGRYRLLSGALSTAFSTGDGTVGSAVPAKPATPPPDGKPPEAVAANGPPPEPEKPVEPVPVEAPLDPVDRAELARNAARVQHMTELATKVDERMQALVRNGQVQVTRGARGIAIEINAAVLFDPARAELKPASFEALRPLAQVLQGFVEPLQIEGHSDDVPIATREYKSNWELSAARAASVGRFLVDQGIAPTRIGIAGYAEFRPLVANASAETRARNRRVTLVVLSADDARPQEGAAQAGDATRKEAVATPGD